MTPRPAPPAAPDRPGRAPRPEELLNFGALAILTVVAAAFRGRLEAPADVLLRYAEMAAGLGLIAFLAAREGRLPRALRFLVDFYPAAFIPVLYETLGPLIAAVRGSPRDDLLIAADRALFGRDVTVSIQHLVRPWLTNFFFLSYTSYYFIALALGLVLWTRSQRDLRRFIFTLTLCYYVSYAGYFLLPALGPRFALAASHTVPLETTALSASIAKTLNELEHTKFDVFPSGHTMIAVAVMLVSFRRARDVFWALFPIASCLVLSTIYCRYHYAVDVVAGGILAVATVPLGDAIYERVTRDG